MLRGASRSLAKRAQVLATVNGSNSANSFQSRHQSSSGASSGGGGGKTALVGFVTVAGLSGGVIGYAGFDPEFRKVLEESVPLSKDVLGFVLGEPSQSVTTSTTKSESAPPSKLKIPMTSSPPMPPLPALDKPKDEEKKTSSALKAPDEKETKENAKPTPEPKKTEPKPKAASSSSADVVNMTFALDQACKDMKGKVDKAVKDGQASVAATRHHMALVRSLMDETDPKEEKRAWDEVFAAANKKTELLKAANTSLTDAKAAVSKAIDKIESGRKNPNAKGSEELKKADASATQCVSQLEKVVSSLDSVQMEAKLVEEYRNLVEEGRRTFQKEIEAILPDSKLGQKAGGTLTEDELNVFMTHAYRKVCQLQQELAKLQTIESKGPRSVKDSQGNAVNEATLQSELDAQRRELEVDQHRKLTAVRDEMEKEMRTQLKRQAAAHADHINDVLEVQSNELSRRFERKLDEAVNAEKITHKAELARLKGTLGSLDKTLEDKEFMSTASGETQELWLAVVALQRALRSSSGAKVNLAANVKAIESATKDTRAFGDDPFLKAVLASIPQEVKSQGVSSEIDIRSRFNRVEEMARRTALIGEDGGSLGLYALSYIQNKLMISPSKLEKMPAKTEVIDTESLNTFDIVWLARGSLESGDLEQAVRYMNLLKGEPRRQAADWIREARHLLETEQACNALLSYASAIGAEAVPLSKSK